jgi:hypothetical protein
MYYGISNQNLSIGAMKSMHWHGPMKVLLVPKSSNPLYVMMVVPQRVLMPPTQVHVEVNATQGTVVPVILVKILLVVTAAVVFK